MTPEDVAFGSGSDECAAWLYRPSGVSGLVPCVVMAHGFSMTRHDGLREYADALVGAGVAVLVIDHRHLGDSGGEPRQRFRASEQADDVRAAVSWARGLPGVDPERIVLWGFSFAGGTAVNVAAGDPRIAGLVLVCPFLDGRSRVLGTLRRTPLVATRIMGAALMDMSGRHTTIPVTGAPGSYAAMAFEGEEAGFTASARDASPWRNEISPGVFATVAFHRPVRRARALSMPVWVCLGEDDVTVSRTAIERLASRAPHAELHRYRVDHFGPCLPPQQALIAKDQADWVRRTFAL